MPYLQLALKFGPSILCAILSGLLWLAWGTNSDLRAANKELTAELSAATATLTSYAGAVTKRDEVIKTQNASINSYKATSVSYRKAYEATLKIAQSSRSELLARADALAKLEAPEGELAQCRAARGLLEKELIQ